jgi:hypothetical protein
MKTKLLSFLILFFANSAKSQIPFFKSYTSQPYGFVSLGSGNFKNLDGSYTMAGLQGIDTTGIFGLNLIKINAEGIVLREKVIKETFIEQLAYDFLQPTIDRGCILGIDKKIIKLDSLFNLEWSKQYYNATSLSFGFAVQQTLDSGYIISSDLIDTSNFMQNNVFIKLNNNGLLQWSSKFQSPNFTYSMKCNKQTNDGGFITCINEDYLNAIIVKRNNLGQIQWSKNIEKVNFFDMIENANGDIVLTGLNFNTFTSNHDISLMKINSLGTILWSKIYRGTSQLKAEQIELGNNGELIISGKVSKSGNSFETNIFCLKTNSLGEIIWSKIYGTPDNLSNVSGNISLSKTADGGGFISYNHTKSTTDLVYTLDAIKTDALGNISCSNFQSNLSLNAIDTSYSITNLSLMGSTIPIITSNNIVVDTISLVNVIDCAVMGVTQVDDLTKVDFFPNPTQGKISLKTAPNQKINHLEVYSALGTLTYAVGIKNTAELINIDISDCPNGLYFIKIYEGNNSYSSKIIKQ